MTLHKEDTTSDVDAIKVWSIKELEGDFASMLKVFQDKESEFNWEARDKSITRFRGILRGNATETPYLEVLIACTKQMVDGIVKAVESLRTQLAMNALLLVGDIGVYIGRHIDAYITDQLLLCMMKCANLTKKMVANASLEATKTFLKHTHFHPKFMNMLNLSMNEKNIQVRSFTITYTKTLLQTHAHHEKIRFIMDRTNSTDHFESIITRGLNDPTPMVKESCREAFWIFWEYWRERGDYILKQLPAMQQKQLEKSKISVKSNHNHKNVHSPTISPRASSSIGHTISPSNSTHSNGSSSNSADHIKRSMSPRAVSPHLRSSYGSPPPSSISSQLHQQLPSSSTSPTPPSTLRKTRVPTLNRKKSSVGLVKRKTHFLTLLKSDDLFQRSEGLVQLAKKLELVPYDPHTVNLASIQFDVPNSPPVDGETLKAIVSSLWDDCYEAMSSWESVTHIIMRLFTFEEYIPKLVLDANTDETSRRTDSDVSKYQFANLSLTRAKLFLNLNKPDLVETLFTSLIQYGGFVTDNRTKPATPLINKKDVTRLPANRRKLTKQFLEWLDELVAPLVGLNEDIDYTEKAYEGVPQEYLDVTNVNANTSGWFESDDNIRQCLAILLPSITTSTSGTMWHTPLVNFMKHIRYLKQRLFESIAATYDEYSVNKICRVLGIHIRLEPPISVTPQPKQEPSITELVNNKQDLEQVEINKQEFEQVVTNKQEFEQVVTNKQEFEQVEINKQVFEQVEINKQVFEQEEINKQDPEQVVPQLNSKAEDRLSMIEPPVADDEILFQDPPSLNQADDFEQPLFGKLTIQERNSILDHDTFTPTESLKEDPIPSVKEVPLVEEVNNTDYFTAVKPIVQEEKPKLENNMEPHDILYKNGDMNSRTVPSVSSLAPSPQLHSSQQTSFSVQHKQLPQTPQQSVLPASSPNPDKYPEPVHVPFFAPEKVSFPNPVFKQNVRSTVTMASTHSTTTNGTSTTTAASRNLKDKTVLLYTLVDKLKITNVDHQNTFRKLTRLFKDVPIRRRWDQGGIEENGSETWAGAQGDAGNFVETVQVILPYLEDSEMNQKSMLATLECVRQLAITQAGLFRYFERKVNDKGKTLESQLMEKLLLIRSNENPTICIAAEDALDAVLGTLNPPTAFEMLMAFIIYRFFISTELQVPADARYHPLGSAFTYLGKWVKEINDKFYIDEWLGKGGVNAFFKGMNHSIISIRKSCVEAIVSFHEVIGDDIYLFLGDLREDQLNLIRHYVAKALKKKASIRSLRDNGQF